MPISDEQLDEEIAKAEQRIAVLERQSMQVQGALMASRGALQALSDLKRAAVPA